MNILVLYSFLSSFEDQSKTPVVKKGDPQGGKKMERHYNPR
jgi:hypothetical protein